MINPYANLREMTVFKGDLHTHTANSDGAASPEDMCTRLMECGFDFCCIADHDLPGVSHLFKDRLLIFPGQELSSEKGHVVALFSDVDRKRYESIAEQIIAVTNSGGYAILSHPNIREFVHDQGLTYTATRLVNELAGLYDGIEIYTHNVGSGLKIAIDRLDVIWTAAVDRSIKTGIFQPVWAFASSDGHATGHITENVGIVVWAEDFAEEAIMNAIRQGAFYCIANTRSRFLEFEIDNNQVRATASNTVLLRIIKRAGLPVKVHSSASAETLEIVYDIQGDEGYLRFEAMDFDGNYAYSNPILIAENDD